MIPASILITLGGNLIVFIVLALVTVGAAIAFYRFTLPPLPAHLRIILASLRALSLVLLLLILFEPIFRLVHRTEQLPTIAVLIDNSRSMTISDSLGERNDRVKKVVEGNYLGLGSSDINVKYYYFAADLKPAAHRVSDSLSFDGDATDIANTLSELKEQLQRENIQAAVIISDGNYTTGKNPLYEAEGCGIPFFSIGVGDTTEQKDVLISKVATNDLAHVETRVPVDVTIKASGYNGENVEVSITEGTVVLDHAVLPLLGGIREYPFRFYIEPKEEGMKKITVRVSHLPGEVTEKNNSRSFFVRVLRSKLRLLLVAGAPNADVSAVRQSLLEDRNFTVNARIQKSASEFYDGAITRDILDSADCIVMVNFPTITTSSTVVTQLQETIERLKKPILFINGKNTDYEKLRAFAVVLPFTWISVNVGELLVSSSVVDRQKMHPLVTLENEIAPDAWQQLPPIYKCQTIFRAKPETDVLAAIKLQTTVLNEPLVLVCNMNSQKSFAVTGQGVWRWRLLAQSGSQTKNFLSLLLSNTIRWLTTQDEGKNVQIVPIKESFTTAEAVEFIGQVYDEQLKPVENADCTVEIKRGSESFTIVLNPIGNGRYEGSLNGIGEGEYSYTAAAAFSGKSFRTDKGKFSVGQTNVEFLETRMNKPLLEQLAYRTGGKYYDLTMAGQVGNDFANGLKLVSKEIVYTSEIELWNWKYLGTVVIILLGMEWFLRKRNGML